MPQGGKAAQSAKVPGGRKVAFSGKQKKLQLQKKKEKKRSGNEPEDSKKPVTATPEADASIVKPENATMKTELQNLSPQCSWEHTRNLNRYKIHFKKESEEELQKRRESARKPIEALPEKALEVKFEDIYGENQEIDIPKRPEWNYILSKYELEAKEQRSFREYVEEIEFKYKDQYVGYFEMNLETWRQLWRVLEMSDIILIIADIRHPIIHFPPGLYRHVTEDLKKDIILVLNKIDLVPAPLVAAWLHYFYNLFPKLNIMCYASYAGAAAAAGKKGRRKGKLRMATNGAKELLKICEKIVQGTVNLSDWHKKIQEEETQASGDHLQADDEDHSEVADTSLQMVQAEGPQGDEHREGILTIGCVGHPNVGKSSLLNAVIGKKVVSVSRTPGHTKHFQTIFLTPTVRLCDCPGLVFPSMVPKPLQVLSGCYPISQLREPYTSIKFLAERISLPELLKLQHPENETSWSAYDICEAWAKKRGFLTSRAARFDTYRAANDLLRMALDGRTICLAFYPPGYLEEKERRWVSHPSIAKIEAIQGVKKLTPSIAEFEYGDADTDYSTEDDDDDEELKKAEYEDGNHFGEENKSRFGLLLA